MVAGKFHGVVLTDSAALSAQQADAQVYRKAFIISENRAGRAYFKTASACRITLGTVQSRKPSYSIRKLRRGIRVLHRMEALFQAGVKNFQHGIHLHGIRYESTCRTDGWFKPRHPVVIGVWFLLKLSISNLFISGSDPFRGRARSMKD